MPVVVVPWVEPRLTPYGEVVDATQLSLIRDSLEVFGWTTHSLCYHPATIERDLARLRCDVVFNLAYGYSNASESLHESQPDVAARLERIGYSCVGASSSSQYLAQDKRVTASLLAEFGVASPRAIDPGNWPDDVALAVLKPRTGARHRNVSMRRRHDDRPWPPDLAENWLLQEYIAGPEYTVAVLEDAATGTLTVLPPLRISFDDSSGLGMMGDREQPWRVIVETESLFRFEQLARTIFRGLGLRDYARFDFRLGADGPVLLDANALPGMHPHNGLLPLAASGAGIDYHSLVFQLVRNAHSRIEHAAVRSHGIAAPLEQCP